MGFGNGERETRLRSIFYAREMRRGVVISTSKQVSDRANAIEFTKTLKWYSTPVAGFPD